MKKLLLLFFLILIGCNSAEKQEERQLVTGVEIRELLKDSISIRAIEIMGEDVAFAGSNGLYGIYNAGGEQVRLSRQQYDSIYPEFRAVASTPSDFFMLSVANPALLFKTGEGGQMELVYKEENENVFYDSMTFWNDREGIAMGDPVENCLSVVITRDGGESWEKMSCDNLPETVEGEAAFAASDSNIAVAGEKTWMISGGKKSRVFYSPDKGETWEVFDTPLIHGAETTGAYSVDFYNEDQGIIIGGDYTRPEINTGNKAVTRDGGRIWELVSDGSGPGYKSSVRYVPGGGGEEIVAVGSTGISYSGDGGRTWKELSEEGFYTIRFLNDSVAYAAGKNRLARIVLK